MQYGERDACGVGFVAHIRGERSRAIVDQGLEILRRLAHRAACGADPDTGDGAGISIQLPEKLFRAEGERLSRFYVDLQRPEVESAIAVVHSRFSTNTFPTWDLAQPFRYIAHNGEINTLRGNGNWMQARRSQLHSAKFHGGLERLFPIIVPGKSDSAQFDNMVELLTLGGRALPHAMMMMIPEAWEGNAAMDEDRKSF